mgnify:CR=1 FL=1
MPDFSEVPLSIDQEPVQDQVEEDLGAVAEAVTEKAKPVKLPAPTRQPMPTGVIKAADLLDQEYVILDLGPYRKYFGSVSNNFDAMFHGQPGAGKTFFLLPFANWLAENIGNTIYISSEELGSVTLQNTIKKTIGKPSEHLYFAKDLKGVDLNDYKAVFMDSVNHVGLDINSYKALREKYPDQIFILILQKTKSGQFKGGKDWEHEIDIAGEFRFEKESGHRILDITSKNRFGTLGEYVMN